MWRSACVLALLFAALTHADTDKREEMSAMPFIMGSRYGRSSPRFISPRNDRFFMGSRYGKRSETEPGVADDLVPAGRQDSLDGRQQTLDGRQETAGARSYAKSGREKQESPGQAGDAEPALFCEYFGVYSLYRCVPTNKHSQNINRRSNDFNTSPGEQV